MKKVIILLVCVVVMQQLPAQIFGPGKIQDPASITRAYLWDRPIADSLNYKGVLPGGVNIMPLFTWNGLPILSLPDSTQYAEAKGYFTKELINRYKDTIVGFEYLVSYVGKFSWIKRKKIKQLSGMQKMTAIAFNEKEKYTVLAQSPRKVFGKRNEYGNIVLLLPSTGTSSLPSKPKPEQFSPAKIGEY